MRGYPQAIGKRPVVPERVTRSPDWIVRVAPSDRERARSARRVEAVERRAREARLQQRTWDFVPDPRWHRRGR